MFVHKDRFVDGMMDFAPTQKSSLSENITTFLDSALVKHTKAEYEANRGSGSGDVAKKRIGAGYIGLECGRALAYKYHKTPKDQDAEEESFVSPGELQRHAEAGHWTEAKTAEWFKLAEFDIRTARPDGKQYGFKAAWSEELQQYRLAGEIDGVILSYPEGTLLPPPPILWESKKATNKKWTAFSKNGVKKQDPKYYGQIQTTMAYMEVGATLFSMLNLDNMKYYFELVRLDPPVAQALTDRAVRVFESQDPLEFPRITKDENDFRCKYCDYKNTCWGK